MSKDKNTNIDDTNGMITLLYDKYIKVSTNTYIGFYTKNIDNTQDIDILVDNEIIYSCKSLNVDVLNNRYIQIELLCEEIEVLDTVTNKLLSKSIDGLMGFVYSEGGVPWATVYDGTLHSKTFILNDSFDVINKAYYIITGAMSIGELYYFKALADADPPKWESVCMNSNTGELIARAFI